MNEKIIEISERLVTEIKEDSSKIRKVVVSPSGDVNVLGESEFIVEEVDGQTEKVELPAFLPARVGKKAFRKLDKKITDGGFEVEDPDTLLDAKDFLINKMFQKAGLNDVTADSLSMSSYNEIGNYYWDKVVEAEKKRSS